MIERFQVIKIDPTWPMDKVRLVMALNCLGSLYYFIKIGLKRNRLTDSLHKPMCERLEREHLKDVIEYPRGHYKTTIHSEGYSLWRALPFTDQHEAGFKSLGYSDLYIQYMKKMHNPFIRILIATSNFPNAKILGKNISKQVEHNDVYRFLFPETLPHRSDEWNVFSMQMHRPGMSGSEKGLHGEGTFDIISAGAQLQSRHYDIVIQDDLVGKQATEQMTTMESVIEWHQLLPGAFDSEDPDHQNDELVVGNRWALNDLNSHIKEHEPEFNFETHSAYGGCCNLHPPDTIIFPERFSEQKLEDLKRRFGPRKFSCQYLNQPIADGDRDFSPEQLKFYTIDNDDLGRMRINFQVENGCVRPSILVRQLKIVLAADPNHGGNTGNGRSRHAVVVWGQFGSDYFLLDYFAERCPFEKFYAEMYRLARKFKLRKVGLETIAAQKYCAFAMKLINKVTDWPLDVFELKGEVEGPDGVMSRKKEWRIRATLTPIFESGNCYIQPKMNDFKYEHQHFPKAVTWDLLDASAYCPNMLDKVVESNTMRQWYAANQARMSGMSKAYSVPASARQYSVQ